MQQVYTKYQDEGKSFELREAQLGLILPGLHAGFDTITAGTDGASTIGIVVNHSKTGITKYDLALNPSSKMGVIMTKHGQIIHIDDTPSFSIDDSDSASDTRYDLIYCQHQYANTPGANNASFGVQKGTTGSGIPTLLSPENKVIIGIVEVKPMAGIFSGLAYYPYQVPSKNNNYLNISEDTAGTKTINLITNIRYLFLNYVLTGTTVINVNMPDPSQAQRGNYCHITLNTIPNGNKFTFNLYDDQSSPTLLKSFLDDNSSGITPGNLDIRFTLYCDGTKWYLLDYMSLKPTQSVAGIHRLSTPSEITGRSGAGIVRASDLALLDASKTQVGMAEFASIQEALLGADATKMIGADTYKSGKWIQTADAFTTTTFEYGTDMYNDGAWHSDLDIGTELSLPVNYYTAFLIRFFFLTSGVASLSFIDSGLTNESGGNVNLHAVQITSDVSGGTYDFSTWVYCPTNILSFKIANNVTAGFLFVKAMI